MRVLLLSLAVVVTGLVVVSPRTPARELRFQGPFAITNVPRGVVTVHEGDIDGNGKLDLISSSGTGTVMVYFQDDSDRTEWTPVPVRVGASCFFTRAGDFDGDGFDDLAVADGSSTAYYVRSRGDRTFDPPKALLQARGSRWIATGDWNGDGILDLASSNLNTSTLSIFVHDGNGTFTQTQNPASGREHTLEALDYDGDGILDLALGTGLPGIQLHKGLGDGRFVHRSTVSGMGGILGCVEYIAVGDFDNDGKDDLAPTCIDDQTAYAGVSLGNGMYRRILRDSFAGGTESSAVGDLNGDGNDDLALVSNGSSALRIYLGHGDGTFEPPLDFGNTGSRPVFLIAADVDRDGRVDVVSADQGSSSLTVFYGKEGEQFLESTQGVSGYGTARDYTTADFDSDGLPDFFYASSSTPEIHVYLKPGMSAPTRPSFTVEVSVRYTSLEVVDLNGDGILDLVGASTSEDAVLAALLDADGKAHDEQSMPCEGNLRSIEIGSLDDRPAVDVAALCVTVPLVATFHGQGDGTFEAGPVVPTIERPKAFNIGDVDGDGRSDLVVIASKAIAIHYGLGGGEYAPAESLFQEDARSLSQVKLADVDGDRRTDILASDQRQNDVLLFGSKGGREFEEPVALDAGLRAVALDVVDVDRDGRLDVTASSATAQTVSFLYNLGPEGFSDPRLQHIGVPATRVRVLDVNGDMVNDIVGFSTGSTAVLLGIDDGPPPPARFRRGDADLDGRLALNDAVVILGHLFRGTGPLVCPDSSDFNDDGILNLTDPIGVLRYLFQGGGPPAPPGPSECGEDTTPDGLPTCGGRC